MATSKLIEHLENIKIFTDFKESGLSSIDEFWERIDSGLAIHNLDNKKFNFKRSDEDYPTKAEIEKRELNKKWLQKNDLTEHYVLTVQEGIITSLEQDNAEPPLLFELSFLKNIIAENRYLKSYLSTPENVLNEYIALSDNIEPEEFFSHLKRNARAIEKSLYPNLLENKNIENPFPRIFTDEGWVFYNKIESDFCKSKDDYAYIFRKFKRDGFIDNAASVKEFIDFANEYHYGLEIEKIKTLSKISNPNREKHYASLKELYTKKN